MTVESFTKTPTMKKSTQDRIEGTAKQARGNVKVGVGKVIGSSRLKATGTADKIAGKVQKKSGELAQTRGR